MHHSDQNDEFLVRLNTFFSGLHMIIGFVRNLRVNKPVRSGEKVVISILQNRLANFEETSIQFKFPKFPQFYVKRRIFFWAK